RKPPVVSPLSVRPGTTTGGVGAELVVVRGLLAFRDRVARIDSRVLATRDSERARRKCRPPAIRCQDPMVSSLFCAVCTDAGGDHPSFGEPRLRALSVDAAFGCLSPHVHLRFRASASRFGRAHVWYCACGTDIA